MTDEPQARVLELEAGILRAAEMVDGWHDDTRDLLLGLLRKSRTMTVSDVKMTVGGCPTVFEFVGDGEPYYFRLRHGLARIVHDELEAVVVADVMPDFDGVCGWDDVVAWAAHRGVELRAA